MSKKKLIAIVAVAVLGGAVLGSMGQSEDEPTSTPEATPNAIVATPEPTTEPTEAPTPEPTEAPIPTDPPESGKYMAYLDWGIEYSTSVVDVNEKLSDALTDLDSDAASEYARELRALHRDSLDWLDANPPLACYAESHAAYREAIDAYETSATAQIRWLDDFPLGSDEDFETYQTYSEIGTSRLEEANLISPDC